MRSAFAVTAAIASLGLSSMLPNAARAAEDFDVPEVYGTKRSVLLECTPYPYGRARVVTRETHATPDFLVSGPIYTTTPGHRDRCQWPGPASYGLPVDAFARIHVQVGETVTAIDPFDLPNEYAPAQFHVARNLWLTEQGLVGQARIVRRAGPPLEDEALITSGNELPEPRAIIPLPTELQENRSTKRLPLEARRNAAGQTVICSSDWSEPTSIDLAAASR